VRRRDCFTFFVSVDFCYFYFSYFYISYICIYSVIHLILILPLPLRLRLRLRLLYFKSLTPPPLSTPPSSSRISLRPDLVSRLFVFSSGSPPHQISHLSIPPPSLVQSNPIQPKSAITSVDHLCLNVLSLSLSLSLSLPLSLWAMTMTE
jgi:hypothetical protein